MVSARSESSSLTLCLAISTFVLWLAPLAAAQDVSVSETPQQTNQRIQTLSTAARRIPHDYVIGIGDLLNISVFDVPELGRDVRVSQTGNISIPLVPVRLHISGLTELQAEQKIAEVLEANGLVNHAEVSVTVKEHRSKPITIVGAVGHPMVYEADRPVTLLEALAEAGGIAADAGDTILVTRASTASFIEAPEAAPVPDKSAPGAGDPPPLDASPPPPLPTAKEKAALTDPAIFPSPAEMASGNSAGADTGGSNTATIGPITVNLNELLEAGDTRNNIVLQAGDVVTVPHAGIIYVLGAVNRPGGFVISNDRNRLTTLKVLTLAGGYTPIAKLDRAVILRKDTQGKQTETQIDLKKILHREAEDLQMRPSDILYVPDSRSKQALLRAAEFGLALGSAVAIWRLAYH